ncbi:hypothetical protein Strain138_000481 [Pseudogemmatithrix spongiicola]|uniref:Uncharacterized protein n=1 Tax=Pseudogemmatithrix spongiicola TaxID=3062599 RepID=A0AA49JSK5_9BACT|nr:hypothetical protein Strain138_000481 [Gemmatimonadaceae bacterium 'strain 138']WKW14155.1 hypothetical protein Strain318_000481 [Gemmatimonadaceae bacterium 'strain 318']
MTTVDCPVCGLVAADRADLGPVAIHCPVCGRYTFKINEAVDRTAAREPAPVRAYLSTYVRERYETAVRQHGEGAYADVEWGEAFTWARSQPWNRPTPGTGPSLGSAAAAEVELGLVRKLLERRPRGYSASTLRWSDYSLFHADSAEAFEALLLHCQRQGWVSCVPVRGRDREWHVSVTGAGERELRADE